MRPPRYFHPDPQAATVQIKIRAGLYRRGQAA
jgi:hypothetical protein